VLPNRFNQGSIVATGRMSPLLLIDQLAAVGAQGAAVTWAGPRTRADLAGRRVGLQ